VVLRVLSSRSDVTQTVLSGNTPASGKAKLEIFGLSDYMDFACAVGGTDAPTRPELVRVAWDRTYSAHGHRFSRVDTVVIGDTPADVDTAHRNGCRLVCVATGRTAEDTLREAGAETVLSDLSDVQATLEAIMGPSEAS
jgi:phosphoglycolate phosphatase-like HAD superfamily hydrolase